MEAWIFNKKELRLIAKLMMNQLNSLPDNSELSLLDLFTQTLHSEEVNGETHEGYPITGYKITDIRLKDDSFLHDHLKWDFENGVWQPGIQQGFKLDQIFAKTIKTYGFIKDSAIRGGRRMGYPFDLTSIWRKRENLISSFLYAEEKVTDKGNHDKYYIRELIETRCYHYRDMNNKLSGYEITKPLQLWRIPKGCKTGIVDVVGDYIRFTVLKGKCYIESAFWRYEKIGKKKSTWNRYENKEELKIYHSAITRCNKEEKEHDAPQKAWFQITNMGKSDLLLFVVDTSKFETSFYEE